MKECDKIYVAKYKNVLTLRQLAEDLRTNQNEILNVIEQLEKLKLSEIYNKIPDEEWEKLEKKKDDEVKKKYYKYSGPINQKVWQEIITEFNQFRKTINQFEQYQQEEKDFFEQYQQEEKYLNEEWKQIGNLNYMVSNYGRIKNSVTNKLKKLKFQKFGMQITLWDAGQGRTVTISRLVAEIFIRHVNSNERVIHIDGNIRNNYYKNLKIVCK